MGALMAVGIDIEIDTEEVIKRFSVVLIGK